MPDFTGARYTVRITHSDGQTFRIECMDLAWQGLDTKRWRFKEWPVSEDYIKTILIAYRPTDPLRDSWFVREINVNRRTVGYPGKARAIARVVSPASVNATLSLIRNRKDFEQLVVDGV